MSFWRTLLAHARREWRADELKPVLLALLVAVAAATGVLAFTERIERALAARSGELIGGDALLSSRQPIPDELRARAAARGLRSSALTAFPTVLFAGEASVLVEVKAVEGNYPLRGILGVGASATDQSRRATAPAPGSVYLDPRALDALGLAVGDRIEIGHSTLRIAGVLLEDPEGAGSLLTLAPRALLRQEDVAELRLLGPASRAFYRLLLAGPEAALEAFAAELRAEGRGIQVTLARDAEQQLAEVGRQARAFFGLAALAVLWLAALAIGLTTRRYTQARRGTVALMRCFGLTARRILIQQGGTLTLYALPAVAVGVGLGYALQAGIAAGVSGLFQQELPAPGARPAVLGALVGVLAYLGFSWPALSQLASTPPSSLLREHNDRLSAREWAAYPLALGVLALAVFLLTGEARVGPIAFLGISLLAATVAGVLALLLRLARRHLPTSRFAWRQAIRQMVSRPGTTLLSSVSLALALAAVLLLGVVGQDLVVQWQRGLGADTPNRFLINILPEQREVLDTHLKDIGIADAELFPFAVGRLVAINGRRPDPAAFKDPRAARFVDGNLNLSWREDLPPANRLIAGQWWSGGAEVSVARTWAEIFDLRPGDTLTVRIGEREITARIANIREVDWDSFRVNFFLLFEPQTVAGLESTWVTSFHATPEQARALVTLLRAYPNLTLIDVEAILQRVLGVIAGVVRSLSVIFWCALAAAVCVLVAAMAVTAGARRFDVALWRSFGASRSLLARIQWIELSSLGALSGGFGGAAALATGWLLARRVFQIDYSMPWEVVPLGAAVGAILCLASGALTLRGVTTAPPMDVLRREA
jgi:putative ABC transport system permease protein